MIIKKNIQGDRGSLREVTLQAVSGREFTLQAVIVGQGLGAIPRSAVRISLDDDAKLGSPPYHIQPTGKACKNISYRSVDYRLSTI